MVEGAAPLLSPVVKGRVIVMELVMEGGMMVIEGAGVTWCVVVTTVGSMACTTMRRMIVVSLPPTKELVLISRSAGVSGGPGQHVIGGVGWDTRLGSGIAMVASALILKRIKRGFAS